MPVRALKAACRGGDGVEGKELVSCSRQVTVTWT